MDAIIGAVVGGLMNCLCSNNAATRSVIDPCTYMINPTKEIASLRKRIAKLIGRADDVKRRLHTAEVEEGKAPTNEVKSWLDDVENVMIEMNVVEDQVKEAKRCPNGLLPDCCFRSNLGHRISKLNVEVIELFEKGVQYLIHDSLSLPVLNKGMELPTTRLVGNTTAAKNVTMIWERLLDSEVGKIGVYGMGGVGKTTIMKEVNNRLVEENLFDMVIWVTISKDATVQKLQNHVGNALGLRLWDYDDEVQRSATLLKSFKQKKKFVLILDDLWESFPIHMIGIPEPTKENGCKIILTSRSLEVCRRMGCHSVNIIKIELLSKDEAWDLFMDKVDVALSPEVTKIAKNVVEECANLPLAIITIGGGMKGNDEISEWRVTLKRLRESSHQITGMEDDVFKCLKFSYEQLADERLKSCFLYCALYPEDYEVLTKQLVDYWIIEGLIQEKDIQNELDQGQVILNKLKHLCLLESGIRNGVEYVKMHDLIREMALDITKERFIVKTGLTLKELQNEGEWGEDLERASFMESTVTHISVVPKCPKLSTLFLNDVWYLYNIPLDFFVHMEGLKVLNLENSRNMQMLPDSISNLVNLGVLCLSKCFEIQEIPSLAKLTSLKMLKFGYTCVKELPHGMEMLVRLTCLDFDLTKLKVLPVGLIAKLSLLEQLHLFGMEENLYKLGGERGFVEELLSLKHLESLNVHFACLSHLISYVGSPAFKGLKLFNLAAGDDLFGSITPLTGNRKVVISNISSDIPVNALILPQNTESLEISKFNNLVSLNELSTRLNELGCLDLKKCYIMGCEKLEYLLSSLPEEGKDHLLPHLEKLHISECPKIYSLCKGIPTPHTLPYLKELWISDCPNMKNLFSSRLLQLLQHLEVVKIEHCKEMEELIISEEGTGGGSSSRNDISSISTISLPPKLKKLELGGLWKLKSIWKGEMVCNSLQRLEIRNCNGLKKLPQLCGQQQSPPPSLQVIYGCSQYWWDSLEWDGKSFLRNLLQPLFQVRSFRREPAQFIMRRQLS